MDMLGHVQVGRPSPGSYISPVSSSSTTICSTLAAAAGSVRFRWKTDPALLSSDLGGSSRVRTRHSSPALKIHASKKTFTSFNDMISNSSKPVLVDFHATWCGPCQFMAPILKDVGAALKDKISVVKVDTERYPQVASRYGIHALPTLVLFVDGKAVDRLEGVQTKEALIEQISYTINAQKANVK